MQNKTTLRGKFGETAARLHLRIRHAIEGEFLLDHIRCLFKRLVRAGVIAM